jgi:hypothetical protein
MAEGGGSEGPNLHAMGLLDGKQAGGDTSKPATNFDDFITQLLEQTGSWISKATGVKISSFFNIGMFGGNKLEDAGIKTGNSIISASLAQGSQGGVAAAVFDSIFSWDFKGTSAPSIDVASGGDSGGGGDSSGGGGGSSGESHSFESYASNSGMGEMFIAAGGGNHFEYRDAPESMLGSLSPPSIGDMSMGRGESMSLG